MNKELSHLLELILPCFWLLCAYILLKNLPL